MTILKMKTSPNGRKLITQREGCVLKTYRDSRGIPTIGVGHVNMTPPVAKMGMTITRAQADEMLAADLGQVEAVINKGVKVPISQNEFDAMASLGFNIGVGGLARSSVIKKLNLGDVKGAADAFLLWSKPAVLLSRRKAERLQFLTPDPAVSSARVDALALKATSTQADAKATNQAAGVTVVTAGAAATAATVAAPHSDWIFWILGGAGLLIIIGIIFAILASRAHAKAATLASNAGEQPDLPAPTASSARRPRKRTART